MSEYQYYEFQAIDRALTTKEIAILRSYSTRATITSTSFVNHYEYGSFKGDEDGWMDRYFDAFMYTANWGTNVLKLRLPAEQLSLSEVQSYAAGRDLSFRADARVVAILRWELSPDALGARGYCPDFFRRRLRSARLARSRRRSNIFSWASVAGARSGAGRAPMERLDSRAVRPRRETAARAASTIARHLSAGHHAMPASWRDSGNGTSK